MEDKQVIKLELVTNLGNFYPFYDLENLLSSFHQFRLSILLLGKLFKNVLVLIILLVIFASLF